MKRLGGLLNAQDGTKVTAGLDLAKSEGGTDHHVGAGLVQAVRPLRDSASGEAQSTGQLCSRTEKVNGFLLSHHGFAQQS